MKKILIIEDDQIVANIYRNKFSVEGYEVEIAHDGQAGLEAIHSFRPDAVVLDLMMPRLTGVELMKKVRAEPEFQKLPIIVFSNTYLSNMVQEAWKAGATKCLSKASCTPKQLLDVLRGAFSANGSSNGSGTAIHGTNGSAHLAAELPASQPPAPPATPAITADAKFQTELRKSFSDSLPANLTVLRTQLQGLIKAEDEPARLKHISDMYRHVHALTSNAGITGCSSMAQMTDALEALLKELQEKPKNINASTLRTVASTVDFVALMVERGNPVEAADLPPASVLVVDDEAISRRAVTYALDKAKLKSLSVESPETAFNLLSQNRYDLVFLDVDMPGMNGFELCAKLRVIPRHKKTPVVFVTGLNDLESRANSMVSGGNDFIAKPFLFMELAVKALVFVLRSRLEIGK